MNEIDHNKLIKLNCSNHCNTYRIENKVEWGMPDLIHIIGGRAVAFTELKVIKAGDIVSFTMSQPRWLNTALKNDYVVNLLLIGDSTYTTIRLAPSVLISRKMKVSVFSKLPQAVVNFGDYAQLEKDLLAGII